MAVYLGRNKVDFVGGQTVNVNGTDTSDATVTSDNLLKNVIAYGKNGQVIGSMPNNGNVSALFDGMNTKQISIPMGYTDGGTVGLTNDIDNEVSEQADLMEQILTTLETKAVPSGGIDTSSADATELDIAQGKTAYVKGEKITGTVRRYENDDTYGFTGDRVTRGTNGSINIWRQVSEPEMMNNGVYYSVGVSGDNFGDAIPEQVVAGATFTSTNGLKVSGTASLQTFTWKKYTAINQSASAAYSLQEVKNRTMYGFSSSGTTYTIFQNMNFNSTTGAISLSNYYELASTYTTIASNYRNYPYIVLDSDYIHGLSDVPKEIGKITSITSQTSTVMTTYTIIYDYYYVMKNEPYARGTYIEDVQSLSSTEYPANGYQDGYWYVLQSNSGLTTKTGTTTSATIDTGLSEIEQFYIYKDSVSTTGLIHLTYNSSGTSYLYASAWSTQAWGSKTIASGTTAATVNGGSITLPSTNATTGGLSASTTYNWVAIGTE